MNLSKRNLYIWLGIILITLPLAYLSFWTFPQWQGNNYRERFTAEEIQKLSSQEKIQLERNIADIENSNRLTLAQIIGGLALLSGLYFTYQNVKTAQDNLRVTEEGKLTERFSKAVELLGSDKLDIRLGGIYALERIARDSQKDHWTVMEVLTAFVRENSPYDSSESSEKAAEKPGEDIQTIITVIGRRKWSNTETQNLNLKKVNLAKLSFFRANFFKADLSESNLSEAVFEETDLRWADLYSTNLALSKLNNTRLGHAKFQQANLFGVRMSNSQASHTSFTHANLRESNFIDVIVSFAGLNGSDLSGAVWTHVTARWANFKLTILCGTVFGAVDFSNSKFNSADLTRCQLTSAEGLTLKQILSAENYDKASLPADLSEELGKLKKII
jgi:uncharacterized protein YjbI with pentapeptide repeats